MRRLWGCESGAIRGSVLALCIATGIPAPSQATDRPGLADFIEQIEGMTGPPDKWGSENIPLKRDAAEILDQRFVREKLPDDPNASARRAQLSFAAECVVKGGSIEPQDGAVTAAFSERVLDGVPLKSPAKEQWRGFVSVCSSSAKSVLGGFVAIVHDTTGVARRGDMGSRLMMRLLPVPTVTAIYAYRPNQIENRATLEAAIAKRTLALATERAEESTRIEAFRKEIAVGSETNCGTVIQMRGPMVEIAVPAYRKIPNGHSTFWSKLDRLYPVGPALCSYGL
jgi:hypothetical protein